MARWILEHKQNANQIQAEEGFMVALQYDIQIRANAFAHKVTLPDGSTLVANISIMEKEFETHAMQQLNASMSSNSTRGTLMHQARHAVSLLL
ncbi:hypothetical protein PCANC_19237 [Puccinia coronata f. sp. avenae]|uniref:Uncharacterized protein n=1 Tax=Puccinia coronata f. sp. avenae TaxID=200324 RepID=A0A2N5U9V6_9BASI|nr:hypothetical protein PCANC_19237 [Puccinia coronata f. sp. avenae]